jgi:ribosome recycling factor
MVFSMLQLRLTKSDDSYSSAAMERMVDEISALVQRLNDVGSSLATINLFHREAIEIDGKRRMMRDFVEVNLGADPTAGTFRVIIHNQAATPGAVTILKENGFINIDTSDRRNLKVVKPRLTVQQEEDLENEVKRVAKNSLQKVSAVKSDAMQRLTAAIKAEYIDAPVAQKARVQLDDLFDDARKHIMILSLIRRKQLLGGGMGFDGPEDESLYRRINDSQYKEVTAALLEVKLPDMSDD